ncbi:unnamed protein product [Boreogadus saida]
MSSARWNPVTVPITGRRAGPSGNQSVTGRGDSWRREQISGSRWGRLDKKQPSVLSVGGQNPDGMKTSFKAWDGLDAECSCGSSTDCITSSGPFSSRCEGGKCVVQVVCQRQQHPVRLLPGGFITPPTANTCLCSEHSARLLQGLNGKQFLGRRVPTIFTAGHDSTKGRVPALMWFVSESWFRQGTVLSVVQERAGYLLLSLCLVFRAGTCSAVWSCCPGLEYLRVSRVCVSGMAVRAGYLICRVSVAREGTALCSVYGVQRTEGGTCSGRLCLCSGAGYCSVFVSVSVVQGWVLRCLCVLSGLVYLLLAKSSLLSLKSLRSDALDGRL